MTEVQFHFNVPDRLLYACRLLRKALRSGARGVAVTAPAATLGALDRTLWAFDPQEFIPHLLLRQGEAPAPRLARTPIWLVERAEQGMQHPVLVHLGEEPAVGFESFQRLIEIVSNDLDERETARRRWKHYAGRGYELQRFDVGAAKA
jgi:DNA polymerase-3 subunit chi